MVSRTTITKTVRSMTYSIPIIEIQRVEQQNIYLQKGTVGHSILLNFDQETNQTFLRNHVNIHGHLAKNPLEASKERIFLIINNSYTSFMLERFYNLYSKCARKEVGEDLEAPIKVETLEEVKFLEVGTSLLVAVPGVKAVLKEDEEDRGPVEVT